MVTKENAKKSKTAEEELQDNIASWKKEFGKVFQTFINGKGYIFRRIKRNEYSAIMSLNLSDDIGERIYDRQAAITKAVVLHPQLPELEADMEELSGLATSISDEVLYQSGFTVSSTIEL